MAESEEQRARRERRRRLFDRIADSYAASRRSYPLEIVEWMMRTAGVNPESHVLEVGCGTGQLTAQLSSFGAHVTAIDIGASMIQIARRQLRSPSVEFLVSSYEDLPARPNCFGLIVSASAFHWIDPDVAWSKSASLLRPGGWLAVLELSEEYDDPIGGLLRESWIRQGGDGGAWTTAATSRVAELMLGTTLFEVPEVRSHRERVMVGRDRVMAVERTRASYLDLGERRRMAFTEDLEAALGRLPQIPATVETRITMASVNAAARSVV